MIKPVGMILVDGFRLTALIKESSTLTANAVPQAKG